ncbi:MAG: hypothetical protein M5U28_16285 [Sandaracinaceae bacterium]|nr:hypothetical protein [Sandaracinaceae bacterium]
MVASHEPPLHARSVHSRLWLPLSTHSFAYVQADQASHVVAPQLSPSGREAVVHPDGSHTSSVQGSPSSQRACTGVCMHVVPTQTSSVQATPSSQPPGHPESDDPASRPARRGPRRAGRPASPASTAASTGRPASAHVPASHTHSDTSGVQGVLTPVERTSTTICDPSCGSVTRVQPSPTTRQQASRATASNPHSPASSPDGAAAGSVAE